MAHLIEQMRTMEVNLVESLCLPRELLGFMEPTIWTFSSPTHSRLLS